MQNFHHIAIVVTNLQKKIDWYCKIYNAKKKGDIFIDNAQNVKVQFIQSRNTMIELLEPLNQKSPIKSFIDRNGSGSIYHIAFEVDNMQKKELEVRAAGGIIASKSKNGWGGMEVMFAIYFKEEEKQLVEYIYRPKN